ncbi:hypothetical protein DPMN_069587 [Dreissena polymorpha]|uniref:Uncharacterized protein n=1 Tax=Dreissena polymorpha TaxID=45954 RepID=A0A9D4BUH1_DREPO|nr:hypothetical protein DPMN_069587 [Dreissena polymorpha]
MGPEALNWDPEELYYSLKKYFIGTNILTKFHEDWPINVAYIASSIFCNKQMRKTAQPSGNHVFQLPFHLDCTNNFTSRVLTRFYYSHIIKNVPPPASGDFTIILYGKMRFSQRDMKNVPPLRPSYWMKNVTSRVKLPRHLAAIISLLPKFHEDLTINVASRVLTRTPAMRLGNIIGAHVLTEFHEDWAITVASRV